MNTKVRFSRRLMPHPSWGEISLLIVLAFVLFVGWSLWRSEQDQACIDRELAEHRPTIDCLGDR